MKLTSLDNIPEDIKQPLWKELNTCALDSATGHYKDESQAKMAIHEALSYSLKMLWQGRTNKLSPEKVVILDWLTKNTLPEELLAQYKGSRSGEVSFKDEDYNQLTQTVTSQTFELFKATTGVNFVKKDNGFSLKKFFGRK